ncbi:hypothetical protein H5410_035677 [Solanum commersonii]|uniref:Secreted protein n=1 Tax=Solanum commersonii TaxID=4109 RepID=A0A9J5Y2J8_SOLCO|nr:hypothetical protein H5410_035677 [Solanum commersonii]
MKFHVVILMILALLLTVTSAQQCGRQARRRACANRLCSCVVVNMGSVARLGLTVDLVARAIVDVMMPPAKVKNLTMMNTRIMVVTTNERMI